MKASLRLLLLLLLLLACTCSNASAVSFWRSIAHPHAPAL